MVRYTVTVMVLVIVAVPVFLGLVALGHDLILNAAYDKVAIRLKDKMALATESPGRRILGFGGSNTFFDFRGADLEALTGLRAVNVGTHSGNGLRFLLWQAEATARPGDIVILSLEDGYYRDPGVTYYGANVSLAMGADFFWTLPLDEQIIFLRNLHIRRLLKVAAARLGLAEFEMEKDWTFPINANGDMEAPVPPAIQVSGLIADVSRQKPKGFTFVPPAQRNIRNFVERMHERNVRVLFTLPGIMENAAPTNEHVADLRDQLAKAGAEFLDLPERGAVPAEMMFDSIYHASTPGAVAYTAQIATALCEEADRFDITCDPGRLREAKALRQAIDSGSYLFDPSPALLPLQPSGSGGSVALEPGIPANFMIAALRGCRNKVKITGDGDGQVEIAIAGKAMKPLKFGTSGKPVSRPLPPTPGLIDVELVASPDSNVQLTGVKRISTCRD